MIINNSQNNASIVIPSISHIYSLGTEFIQSWMYSKIDKNIFKTIYVQDSDPINEMRTFSPIDSLVKNKPSLSIESRIDSDYLNEANQMPDGGMDLFVTRTRREACFYNDPKNKINMALNSQTVKIIYNIKIRVRTKMQQIDWMHYIKQALRIGETQTLEYDMDFHIPKNIMIQLAKDSGFEIDEEKKEVKDIYNFLHYINQYSYFPFTYKIRTVNQRMEFFIRLLDMPFHISCVDNLSIDDGEKINMVSDNFTIEFPIYLTLSAPKMYIYYSKGDTQYIYDDELDPNAVHILMHTIQLKTIPDVNCKGWAKFITADYDLDSDEDPDVTKKGSDVYINFRDLIKDDKVEVVYNYAKRYYIHPSSFMEFRAYEHGVESKLEMNWDTLVAKTTNNTGVKTLGVVMYLNKAFVNERLLDLTNERNERITPTIDELNYLKR